jgi:DNA-binding MarR family transcriptional regulator
LRYINGVPRGSIHLDLLRALAGGPEQTASPAPELARALGTSAQFVVAKLRPLVSAGLVTRHSSRSGRLYMISNEGRDYLMRNEPTATP